MSDHAELERARIRMTRYRVLAILNAGNPYPVGEGLIAQVLDDCDLQPTPDGIRRSLQYLADKGLVSLDMTSEPHWQARLLPAGVDYLEDPRASDPGIARPPGA